MRTTTPTPVWPIDHGSGMIPEMSENLTMLGAYSAAMERGDRNAVFEHWGGPHGRDGVGLTH